MAFNAIHENWVKKDPNDYAVSSGFQTHYDGQFGNSYAYIWDDASLNSIKSLRLESVIAHAYFLYY